MKKILFLILVFSLSFSVQAQKKSKRKNKTDNTGYDSLTTTPVTSTSSKKSKKGKKEISTNYVPEEVIPEPDTSKKFTGVIKYRITSDDPADHDSVFVVFGEHRIHVTQFIPGYRADQVFEKIMIANLNDSSFLELDPKNKTYKTEKLGKRNSEIVFSFAPDKKTGKIMNLTCEEYAGEMTIGETDVYEAACLVSKLHYFNSAMYFNLMNIQPLVLGYKIVLGFRTKSPENENTYIIAYKIEPGITDSYFDLSGYRAL